MCVDCISIQKCHRFRFPPYVHTQDMTLREFMSVCIRVSLLMRKKGHNWAKLSLTLRPKLSAHINEQPTNYTEMTVKSIPHIEKSPNFGSAFNFGANSPQNNTETQTPRCK